MTRKRRFGQRLLVVVAVIAALIGLGYIWRSSPLASIVSDGSDIGRRRGDGAAFSLNNIGDLLTTIAIGVGGMSFVILIDKARRHRRPIRPAPKASTAVGTET
ncbi:MAG: hypothetical protein ABIQ39_12125 [Ilumatobacteraceae bacterium]